MRPTPVRIGILSAVTAFAALAVGGEARAQQAIGQCEYYVSGSCDVACSDIDISAGCDIDYYAECEGRCDVVADVTCSATCEADCSAQCTIDPGSFECQGYCEADCSGQCEALCTADADSARCLAECQGSCTAGCEVDCQATPPEADCTAQCQASCDGSCTAQADVQCQAECQAELVGQCELNATGQCTGSCESDGGVLICNGEAVTYGTYEDAYSYAESNGYIEIRVEGSVSCSAAAGTSPVSGAAWTLLMFGALGLTLRGARRRRR